MPAPAGKGLVIGETGKRVLTLAGVSDVLSRTKGSNSQEILNFWEKTFKTDWAMGSRSHFPEAPYTQEKNSAASLSGSSKFLPTRSST